MPGKTTILMTGVTGYIGGTVLSHFLKHPDFSSFHVKTLVRSKEKAAKLASLGVEPVVGSLSDEKFVEDTAAQADVVFAMADADNFEASVAILRGLKRRNRETGSVPILIHTSGTGVLVDDAKGDHGTDTIYDDANPDQIESLPDTQLHRNVDLEVLRADKEGYLKSYIVLPSTIWGIATGVLVEKGIQNPHSQQVPQLVRASLARGRAGMVGEGKNIWPDVHIDDIAQLYIVLFDSIRKNPTTGHGREGFYFGETGEHTMQEVGKAIQDALIALGKAKTNDTEPSTFTQEEIDKYLDGSTYLGTNSRCRANRSRSIGWKPTKTKEDFLKSIKPEVEALADK
ncbi:NAD-binding protein [Agrocybe pediades]|nr:NAD-binding protein [Agrocybe pediades]